MNTDIEAAQAGLKTGCAFIVFLFLMLFAALLWKIWERRAPWQTEQYVAIGTAKPSYVISWQHYMEKNPDSTVNGVVFDVDLLAVGRTLRIKKGDYQISGAPFSARIFAYQTIDENAEVTVSEINVTIKGKDQRSCLLNNQPITMNFKPFRKGYEIHRSHDIEDYKEASCSIGKTIDAFPTKKEKVSVFFTVEVTNPSRQEGSLRKTLRYDFEPRVDCGQRPRHWLAK